MSVPKRIRDLVKTRDNGLCIVQGPFCLGEYQVLHHRANRGAGGASGALDSASNLVASCSLCNNWIEDCSGADRAALVARGMRVEGGRTHAHTAEKAREAPVLYPDGRWWLLDDAGGKTEWKEAA